MSVLQERLMLVLGDTGRVAVAQSGLMARLQERWPTPHGYAPQSVDTALKSLREAGSVHCSPAGKWTRFVNLKDRQQAEPQDPPADPIADEPETEAEAAAVDDTTQETDVSQKTKVCTGKCGEEKPVGEFYANSGQCKRCVLNRQKELKAAKEKGVKPPAAKASAAKTGAAKVAATAITNLRAKAAVKKTGAAQLVTGNAMVAISFALKIEDIHGVFHELSVAGPTVKRLVNELREYA